MQDKAIGPLLRELRVAQRLSLNQLARQAGIGVATLSRWEAGTAQPRLQELDAALTALRATSAQKRQILAQMDAPRAMQRLRQERQSLPESRSVLPPSAGGLLRALRQRRALTQAQVAARMNVAQSTLARWEQGDMWPCSTDLHRLCYILGAHESEVVALTCCPESLAPPLADAPLSCEEARAWVRRHILMEIDQEQNTLVELHFWQMMARLWPLRAAWGDEGRLLLAEACAHHAQWLMGIEPGGSRKPNTSRRAEAIYFSEQAMTVLRRELVPALIASLTLARLAVFQRGSVTPARGVALLRAWTGRKVAAGKKWTEESLIPEYAAWLLRDMAEYMALMGRREEALRLSVEASQLAACVSNPMEKYLRDSDQAELLLLADKPREALNVLPPFNESHPRLCSWGGLQRAEGLYRMGQRNEAHDVLQRTLCTIQTHNLTHLRERADRLVRLY